MGFIRKAIHLKPQFGHNNLADAHIDPSHLIKDTNRLRTAQELRGFRLRGKRWDSFERLRRNWCLTCLLFGWRVVRGVRCLRVIGIALQTHAMSNLLI